MSQVESLSSTNRTLHEIDILIRARYPILYLLTHEESRLEMLISGLAKKQNKHLLIWTATQGLRPYQEISDPSRNGDLIDPIEVLNKIQSQSGASIFILKDFHPFLENPRVVRRLRDAANDLKGTYKSILIVSPKLNLPVELEKDVTLIDIPLPDTQELMGLLKSVCLALKEKSQSGVTLNSEEAWSLVRAARGLTLSEAENAFAKAVVDGSTLDVGDVEIVIKEKQQIIRKSGILEFYPADSSMGEIGGLENLKHWLDLRGNSFSTKAASYGLPAPKGVLLLGAPGCGKSLTAKAVANAWRMPLLRLDFGRIFSGFIGSSEENMRRALKIAEGISPAILWIDEIEKGLAGGTSGQSDAGTAARVFGTFLTWMQEKTSTVFVVATANRIDALPPELLRRGRFDEIFFVDLPSSGIREKILGIHLQKRKRDPRAFSLSSVAAVTEGFSGAELEQVIVEGLFTAYGENREVKTEDLTRAASETVPLSKTYAEELKTLRAWIQNRARPADRTAEALRKPDSAKIVFRRGH